MLIQEAVETSQLQQCFPVVKELRPHLTKEIFVEQAKRQRDSGYHLMYISITNKVVTILGYRLTEHLAWGKALYIDDFATHLHEFRSLNS